VIQLLAQGRDRNAVGESNRQCAVVNLASDLSLREVLPDELEHQEFVEVGVEEGAHDGVELPVVVVRALGEVDVHGEY
jgi:hypothetical protein